jgi:NarL family two-component system response regulator LiaR
MSKIRILIVDDHEMVRLGISSFLSTEEDMEVVGEAANGLDAIKLVEEHKPEVILMDLVMPVMDGIETTRKIKEIHPEGKVIILTSFIDDQQVFPAIEAGAFSYLLKSTKANEIAEAIRNAVHGESVIEPAVAKKLMDRMRRGLERLPHEDLTEREMEVLLLLGEAKTNQEIADELFIGIKTVKTHVSNILQKLGFEDRTQAAVYVHKNGLLKEKRNK